MKKKTFFDCVVVTGLSGAGKSVTLHALEDLGYFCVDNLPLKLLPSLIQLYQQWGQRLRRIAVGVDVRTSLPEKEFSRSLENLRKEGFRFRVLFLDADTQTLMRRFSETRRRHPLGGSVLNGIRRERRLFHDAKGQADKIIDTSHLAPGELREIMASALGLCNPQGTAIVVMSFGYKYGVPLDADVVWDVRFLPNPNYVPQLRLLTGKNAGVSRYVLDNKKARQFVSQLESMMGLMLDSFSREGRSYLTVAIGCTGGRHRSVAVAECLAKFVKSRRRFVVHTRHRDILK